MKRFAAFVLLAILLCSPAFAIQARFVSVDALWTAINANTAAIAAHAARLTALEAQLWEDLRFPSTGINLAGAPAAPGVDTTTFYGSLEFSGSQINDAAYQVQMPHGWLNASPIMPHLHVVNGSTSTATTTWEIWHRIADVNEDFPAVWSVATVSAQLVASTTRHQMISFAPINMTGKSDSCMLSMLVRRLGSDEHASIIRLLEFDIHYLSETRGSVAETGDH